MKREPSTAARALRAVSLVITLVSIVTFSTALYSVYSDVSGVFSSIGSGSGFAQGHGFAVSGNTATLNLNITVKNSGLYPLSISFGCKPDPSVPATCSVESVSVPVGATEALPVVLTITDMSRLQSLITAGTPIHFNATAEVSLVPFATLTANFDLGNTLSGAVA